MKFSAGAAAALTALTLTAGILTVAAADVDAGRAKAQQCIACHGDSGISPSGAFPNLAGQHAEYLVQTLRDYKSGARKNAVMGALVGALSEEDMQDIAAFYASQPGLFTPVKNW
ncbi:MAG: cytochrome c [Gammaproteobacteria bacterium]|nr:cytochrome c [Gammaproteobacteria bacterium]